jgi:hypothetical protein
VLVSSCPTKTTQLRFDAIEREIKSWAPLVTLDAVRALFRRSEDDAKFLYEGGYLQFAFNLADKGATRAEVRIFNGSIEKYAVGDLEHLKARGSDAAELDAAVRACLPPERGPVKLSALTKLWTISSTHLHDLGSAGEIALLPGQTLKQKQTPLLVRASVAEFLKRRRIV